MTLKQPNGCISCDQNDKFLSSSERLCAKMTLVHHSGLRCSFCDCDCSSTANSVCPALSLYQSVCVSCLCVSGLWKVCRKKADCLDTTGMAGEAFCSLVFFFSVQSFCSLGDIETRAVSCKKADKEPRNMKRAPICTKKLN